MEYETSANIYLCRADCSLLGTITGIKPETCSLTENATNLWELKFDIDRFINSGGELEQSDYYDSIDDMMRLYLDGDGIRAFFMIDAEPVISGNGSQETKSVTAHSIECELSYMQLKNFKVNCGTPDSQEYLATDGSGNPNNINPYTGLPYEYISLVNYGNTQLSLLHLVLDGTGWAVRDGISEDLCGIKKSFDISGSNRYAFLMKTVSPAASVIFEFDRKHKTVGIVKAEDYGEDTGVFVTMRNLMNSFEVTSTSNEGIMTQMVPSGANNLGIEYVNFGRDYIINLDYFMNTFNEYGDYKFVSSRLHDKYSAWKNYRETEAVPYNGKNYTRRELYRELTKLYNKAMMGISELRNRVPNDGCVIDYKTFPLKDLKVSLTAYNNALVALITLYKSEYGVTQIGDAPGYSPTPSSAVNIKNTPYWHDFYAYKEKIIPQVTEALKMYCRTDANGNLVVDGNGNYIELEYGNPAYYADNGIVKSVDSYLYEWSLYGLDELEAKKKAWSEAANLLFNECFITGGTVATPTAYRTADDGGWNGMNDAQRKQFTSKAAFIDKLNKYLDYMSFNVRANSLTGTNCKGVIRQCDDAIVQRKNEISVLENKLNEYDAQRRDLAASTAMENFKLNGGFVFTSEDLTVINGLIRETEYSNENILTTSLDDIASTVDVQEELYQAAVDELYKISQPQYSFKTEMDNLYALEEFRAYREPFKVGNFIRVGLEIHEELCDNNFIKLRLISISRNPMESNENLSVEFSTMTKTLNGLDDLDFLLDSDSASSVGSSSSSSSSGGTYGSNDANVQMSNNMIKALLSTELFGGAVTDAVLDSIRANRGNFNTLFANSGVFDSLEAGQIKVSGDCLFDWIKSGNYIEGKSGSMLNLIDGSFSLAAGALSYDPKQGLTIEGGASDDAVSALATDLNALSNGLASGSTNINGGCVKTGNIVSNNYNGSGANLLGNTLGSILCLNDGRFNLGGILKWNGEKFTIGDGLEWNNPNSQLSIKGIIEATSGKFSGNIESDATISGGTISGANISGGTIEVNTDIYKSGLDYRIKISPDKGMELKSQYIINKPYDSTNYHSLITLNPSYGIGFGGTVNGFPVDDTEKVIYNPNDNSFPRVFLNFNGLFLNDILFDESLTGSSEPPSGQLDGGPEFSWNGIRHPAVYGKTITNGKEVYVGSGGTFGTTLSSKRFKNSISSNLTDVSNPHGLYDIDVVQFKYNGDCISLSDSKDIDKMHIGLIAEDVERYYKIGATYDEYGKPDGWSLRYMFPAALKLIQEQHEEIEELKRQFQELKTQVNNMLGKGAS